MSIHSGWVAGLSSQPTQAGHRDGQRPEWAGVRRAGVDSEGRGGHWRCGQGASGEAMLRLAQAAGGTDRD